MHKLLQESEKTQKQLNRLLKELAKNKDENSFKSLAEQICNVYFNENFRHIYSEFFPLIVELSKEEEKEGYSLEILGENLQLILKYAENKENLASHILKSLFKLTDHLNLEIARFNQYSTNEDKIKDLEKQNQQAAMSLKEKTRKLDMATNRLNSVQTELIAVLSIFAAIVLTFSGSMSLIGNALSNIENAPFFKSIFFIALCGFIVLNLIFLMMYIVGKITGRNIYAHCKTEYCTCGENNMPACNGFNRIRKRLPYIFWINTILLIIIIIGFILSIKPDVILFISLLSHII